MTEIAYISIGSNLNNPYSQVKSAVNSLKSIKDINIESISQWYSSEPMGPANQPKFEIRLLKFLPNYHLVSF